MSTDREGTPAQERPLPPRGWHERDVERVEPEDIVVDARSEELPSAPETQARPGLDECAGAWLSKTLRAVTEPGGNLVLPPDSWSIHQDFSEEGDPVLQLPPGDGNFAIYLPSPPEPLPAPVTESRALELEAPAGVQPGHRFAVSARLLAQALPGLSVLAPVEVPAQGLAVHLDLHVRGPLQLASDSTAQVLIHPGRDSDPVRFELVALAAGTARLAVRAFAGARYLGEAGCDIDVTEVQAGSALQTVREPVQAGAGSAALATLEIDVAPGRQQLCFRLRGPGAIGIQPPFVQTLNGPLDAQIEPLIRQLDRLAQQPRGWSDRGVEAVLQGLGADLWERLLPPGVKQVLLTHLDEIQGLSIVGADDPVPWELLYPTGAGTPGFLCDRLDVSRWAFGVPAPVARLGLGGPAFVLPQSAPPAAAQEIAGLAALLGQGPQLATLDELLDCLERGGFGTLHFAAHNFVAGTEPAAAWLQLDQPFQQAMLGPQYRGRFSTAAPLVFMNACNSGNSAPLWVGSTSWAGRFLMAGAGAFVGSFWQVRDQPAGEFAASFYGALGTGEPLGRALRKARDDVRTTGDPTRLAYTLFGDPDARMAPHQPQP